MRLIDADALIEDIGKEIDMEKEVILNSVHCAGMRNVIRLVKRLPTVDPVKHGHWIKMPHIWSVMYKCSACGSFKDTQYCYCPRCGARMDGDESESD